MKKKRGFTWAGGLLLGSSAAMLSVLPAATAVAGPESAASETQTLTLLPMQYSNSLLPQGNSRTLGAATSNVIPSPLPANLRDVATKAAANAAFNRAAPTPGASAAHFPKIKYGAATPGIPSIVGNFAFAGQFDPNVTPPDSTGAVGLTRYVQLVNQRFAIYSRGSSIPLSQGTLDAFTSTTGLDLFDPQIIWDSTTKRFYSVVVAVDGAGNGWLVLGYSRTAEPNTAADWCTPYMIPYGAELPDYPKLGDTQNFWVIGVNAFNALGFRGADAGALTKPPAGPGCAVLQGVIQRNLTDAGTLQKDGVTIKYQSVFTPVPANQIDTALDGYIVARNDGFSAVVDAPPEPYSAKGQSERLWTFRVTQNAATGLPVIDPRGKPLVVPAYAIPPNATQRGELYAQQPVVTQILDTLDARPTQAIMARNPLRGGAFSLWTQQTVCTTAPVLPPLPKPQIYYCPGVSGVRWYEINPRQSVFPFNPAVRATGLVTVPDVFLYNAAISPDRKFDGVTTPAFGDSFVMTYTMSSLKAGLWPLIAVSSSYKGSAVSAPVVVKPAVGPYRDFSCVAPGSTCRWGDYSGAAPDPRPSTFGTGAVWLTNQYAGFVTPGTVLPPTNQSNWRTWIWAAQP